MTNYSASTWYFPQKESVTACTDALLPEYETYLHVCCSQIELTHTDHFYLAEHCNERRDVDTSVAVISRESIERIRVSLLSLLKLSMTLFMD